MKIEFENIDELKEFAELITRDNGPKEEVTTEQMANNQSKIIETMLHTQLIHTRRIDDLFERINSKVKPEKNKE